MLLTGFLLEVMLWIVASLGKFKFITNYFLIEADLFWKFSRSQTILLVKKLNDRSGLLVFLSRMIGWHISFQGKVGWDNLLQEPFWSNFNLKCQTWCISNSQKISSEEQQSKLGSWKERRLRTIKKQSYTYN